LVCVAGNGLLVEFFEEVAQLLSEKLVRFAQAATLNEGRKGQKSSGLIAQAGGDVISEHPEPCQLPPIRVLRRDFVNRNENDIKIPGRKINPCSFPETFCLHPAGHRELQLLTNGRASAHCPFWIF
jgi:hypothetical protein